MLRKYHYYSCDFNKFSRCDLVMHCYSYWITSPSWLMFWFGSLEYDRQISQNRMRNQQSFSARYKLPGLFSAKLLDVVLCRSLSDWSVDIRAYRIIPYYTPIFDATRLGDIGRVQSLLASREAFTSDRDQCGRTLLHVSLRLIRITLKY